LEGRVLIAAITELVFADGAATQAERKLASTLCRTGELKDEARRRIEREPDLRDTLLANLRPAD
jgi:hypothetical protein